MRVDSIKYKIKKESPWAEGFYVSDLWDSKDLIFTIDWKPLTNRFPKIWQYHIIEESIPVSYTEEYIMSLIKFGVIVKSDGSVINTYFRNGVIDIDKNVAIEIKDIAATIEVNGTRVNTFGSTWLEKDGYRAGNKVLKFMVEGIQFTIKEKDFYYSLSFNYKGSFYEIIYGQQVNKDKEYWKDVTKKQRKEIDKIYKNKKGKGFCSSEKQVTYDAYNRMREKDMENLRKLIKSIDLKKSWKLNTKGDIVNG